MTDSTRFRLYKVRENLRKVPNDSQYFFALGYAAALNDLHDITVPEYADFSRQCSQIKESANGRIKE